MLTEEEKLELAGVTCPRCREGSVPVRSGISHWNGKDPVPRTDEEMAAAFMGWSWMHDLEESPNGGVRCSAQDVWERDYLLN
jgi:hypothetical protein